jgi:hypothetical protein
MTGTGETGDDHTVEGRRKEAETAATSYPDLGNGTSLSTPDPGVLPLRDWCPPPDDLHMISTSSPGVLHAVSVE